ncbi:AIR synthase family protein, partial [Thermodesulfobacteriota bacterium]
MRSDGPIPAGKLSPELLDELIKKYTFGDDSIVVGPGVGEDAAVIEAGKGLLIVKTDPITFVTESMGSYLVQVNANDIAAMGGEPRWFMVTLLLAEYGTTPGYVRSCFMQISEACKELGIVYCGGHTEVTVGLPRPMAIGVMVGEVDRGRLVRTSGAVPGDDIILTKGAAIEATSIVARERGEELAARYSEDFVRRCRDFVTEPGLSVLNEARLALDAGRVHCMHDPTEGGVITALHEIASAAGTGLHVVGADIPIAEETRTACGDYGIDPLGALSSGALLLTVAPEESRTVVGALNDGGIEAAVIGRVQDEDHGRTIETEKGVEALPVFA